MSSTFSVGGLSSGLDTESIISQLLQIERIPITQAGNRQGELRKVDSAWSGVVSKLSAIRAALDDLDAAADYGSHSTVTSSSDAVTATRTGSPATGGLTFTVSQLAQAYQGTLSGATTFTAGDDLAGDGVLKIMHADGAGFTSIDTTGLTLSEVATAISTHAELDANASVQPLTDGSVQLMLSSRRTGSDGGLVFDLTGAPAGLNTATELFAAQDAQLTMGSGPGAPVVTSPTNRLTGLIDGVTIDLSAQTTTPVTVEVRRDVTVTATKVRELVDALNGAITDLKTKTNYDTTTNAAGTLQGDATATSLRFDLAAALTGAVSGLTGTYGSGTSIGIEVTRDGLITLDDDKLAAALADDYDGVVELLTAPAAPGPGEAGPGLFSTLDGVLDTYEGSAGAIAATRDGLTARIADYDDQIERYEVRLELRERLLRQKFAGLEAALSAVQAQGASLLAALGSTGDRP